MSVPIVNGTGRDEDGAFLDVDGMLHYVAHERTIGELTDDRTSLIEIRATIDRLDRADRRQSVPGGLLPAYRRENSRGIPFYDSWTWELAERAIGLTLDHAIDSGITLGDLAIEPGIGGVVVTGMAFA
jgi:hypothetical protein